MGDFVHLHVHSDHSLGDAAVSVMSLADRAEELGMEYLALTDHGNMFGAMEFLAACRETVKNIDGEEQHVRRKRPVMPILGCEFYVAPGSRFDRKEAESEEKYFHLILLAANREGYRSLIELCSLAYTEGFYYKPRIDDELLARRHEGLVALSACASGEIPRLIQAGKVDEAEKKALFYRDLFGEGNFYLEIQDHGIPSGGLKGTNLSQRQIAQVTAEISGRTGIPLVATNDVHYLRQEDSVVHDVHLCIGTAKLRTDQKRKRYYGDQFYFKSAEEMAAVFPEYPEALANTVKIARRCTADFLVEEKDKKTGEMRTAYRFPTVETKRLPDYLPEFPMPEGFSDEKAYLRHLAAEGLARRYPAEKAAGGEAWGKIQERCEYELGVITRMGFSGYYLIVADFINWAKEHGIPVGPGRGSGAGSIVAYAIRITDIDPLKYGLLFERFLNPERISMPDFDVDFANEGRDEVIRYVKQKYGSERVGQIITFGTLGAKQVIKDVARTLGISIPESTAIANLIPKDPKITLEKAFRDEPRLGEMEKDPRYTELFYLARKLEGLKRHASIHAGGVVIGRFPLSSLVPLYVYRDKKTRAESIATQYTMGYLEQCGLVKMDFLGLKTLDLIKNIEEIIRRRGGEYGEFSVEKADEKDPATYRMLAEGNNEGVFQFEKDWWKGTLKQSKPSGIDELTALTSLGRPGPMQFIPQYIDCKWGRKPIQYPAPALEETLRETYGVIVYQEQVMQVARTVAGYSMGQADKLRKAMGKKKKEIIEEEKKPFIAGAVKQGYTESDAARIYDIMAPFAGYGFNKSHAAAYSVLSFRTAYLKAHFPAEFMAANLSNEINSTDKEKLPWYISVTRSMGIPIDPPDVNRSHKLFTVVDGRIVYGFKGIKGVGEWPSGEIISVREEGGPFKDFMDFLERVDIKKVGKSTIEILVQAGAFDAFDADRSTLLANFERVIEYALKKQDDRRNGQGSLFEDTGETEYPDFVFEPAPPMNRHELLQIEKKLLGFYFSGHPLDEYRSSWERSVSLDLGHPDRASPDREYTLLGMIKAIRPFTNKKGKSQAFATLGDFNGDIDLTFFPEIWEKHRDSLAVDKIIALRGKVYTAGERVTFTVTSILDMEDLVEKSYRELHIRLSQNALSGKENLYPLRDRLFEGSGPCSVFIHVPLAAGEGVVRAAAQITAGVEKAAIDDLALCEGVAEAWRE